MPYGITLMGMYIVLQKVGVFSQGGRAGNAVGFKINSLTKLVDTKANRPRMNMMHFIVEVKYMNMR